MRWRGPSALQRFRELFPAANILWDTHHTWHEGGEAPASTWPRCAAAARTSTSGWPDRCSRQRMLTVPHGEGDFPHDDLIGALARDRFDGIISFEWERHWDPDLAEITGRSDPSSPSTSTAT